MLADAAHLLGAATWRGGPAADLISVAPEELSARLSGPRPQADIEDGTVLDTRDRLDRFLARRPPW
jgi:hypothetical protein